MRAYYAEIFLEITINYYNFFRFLFEDESIVGFSACIFKVVQVLTAAEYNH